MKAALSALALLAVLGSTACATAAPGTASLSKQPTQPPSQESPLRARTPAPASQPATSVPSTPIQKSASAEADNRAVPTASSAPEVPELGRVQRLVEGMTLEEKVGQVFMLGVDGTEPEERTLALLRSLRPGGVTLFARNVESPAQVRRLVDGLQSAATDSPGGARLFVSIDQEGGLIGRIGRGVTLLPGNMALGAADDPALARAAGAVLGRELGAMGINMNLAPVVDVNSNPANPVIGVRSFGSSPERVGELGAALIGGLQEGGVMAVAKHFPGHGDTSVDSHYGLPVVDHPRARLDEIELAPFRAAVSGGVDAIMTAHVVVPALEPRPQLPASLSSNVLEGLLREELGFDGLVLTDALDMAAVKDGVGVARGAVEAFKAGSDMLLIAGIKPEDMAARTEAYEALLSAVRSGEVPEARLDASVTRILEAKEQHGVLDGAEAAGTQEELASAAHQEVARDIAAGAVTLVRDESGIVPLQSSQSLLVVRPMSPLSSQVEDQTDTGAFGQAVRALAPGATELVVSARPSASEIERAVRAAGGVDRVIVATYDAWRWPRQRELVRAVLETGTPGVVVGLRAPYDLLAMPELPAYMVVYSDRPASLEAAAAALFGRTDISGRLPVDLPGLYPRGHGIARSASDAGTPAR